MALNAITQMGGALLGQMGLGKGGKGGKGGFSPSAMATANSIINSVKGVATGGA